MKLIASKTSPFARKVRIVLAEKNIPCDFIVDIPWDPDTEVPKFNPLGKVPVLVRDGGDTLYDSRVIVEYLEQVKPWPMLIPAEAEAMIEVKKWEALADGVGDAAAAIFIERKRPEAQQSTDWIARQRSKIDNGLAAMNTSVEGPFCMGNSFTLADIAVGSCLGYLDFRFPEIAWRDRYPALRVLDEKLATRPSFAHTLPEA
ncbi:MAG: glutathione S-transferase family protein [Moraxellaceae bacterium]|jgi:glutathione S-transferase|nr:glutathione S-transferase family protein [Moraxellaceae bacterium]